MSTTTTPLDDALAAASKMAGIPDFQEANGGLVNRRLEMRVLLIALAAQLHVILHGNPGRAKSMTVDAILRHFDGVSKFKTQAYKASPPEQFLGPISLKQMEDDRFVRIIKGKVADTDVAVLDELPRAPRALLPALQGMMVEREFDAGDGVQPVPLMSLIGTSNHLLDDPELQAFFDRFALKLVVQAPASQDQFKQIMRGALQRRSTGVASIPDSLIVSRDELVRIQRGVELVLVPDPILDAMGELWSNLLGQGIEPSIRRYVDLTKAMQASALLHGRDEVEIDDLQIAEHSLWTSEDEIPAVHTEVIRFASEWVKEAANLLESFQETLDRLGQVQSLVAAGSDQSQRVTIGEREQSITDHSLRVVNELKPLRGLIEQHVADASAGQNTADLQATLTQIDAAKGWISDRILGGLVI